MSQALVADVRRVLREVMGLDEDPAVDISLNELLRDSLDALELLTRIDEMHPELGVEAIELDGTTTLTELTQMMLGTSAASEPGRTEWVSAAMRGGDPRSFGP